VAATDIREAHNFVAGLLHQVGGQRTHVSESLDHHAAALLADARFGERFITADHYAAAGGFTSSARYTVAMPPAPSSRSMR
jgi:hypothetical protein